MNDQFGIPLAPEITVGGIAIRPEQAPRHLQTLRDLGIVCADGISGQIIHRARWPEQGLYEARATRTPRGDYLVMFPDGGHYGQSDAKVNDMLAYRSSDNGQTWQGPTIAFDIDYDQHGFVPLIPRGTEQIYAFGTQPIPGLYTRENGLHENTPIGYRFSEDDGHTWSDVHLIRPENDPDFKGMSVMRMCETDAGTWLIGSHEADWSYNPLMTRQYLLRSEDRGQSWQLLPARRHGGWCVMDYGRMDEGRPITLGNGEVYCMFRTPAGRLWQSRSCDDGTTWSDPQPTPLVHPDAPPMLFMLSDGKTLAAFHHNRYSAASDFDDLGDTLVTFLDRAEIWVSLSRDHGHTWGPPRFVLANALVPTFDKAFRNYQCSYLDMFTDAGNVHLFVPHRWERVLHLRLPEEHLRMLPRREELLSSQVPA
ncbi:MAG: sialidase family protein [Planctomycetota bacterium]